MANYPLPKKNTAYTFYVGLIDQSNTKVLKANPTLAAGDFKVSIDGGAFANLASLPTVSPASGVSVAIALSSSEMNGDNIAVACIDPDSEWCDQFINIQTATRGIDDLAYPATSGRSMVVDAAGLVDANAVKVGPSGSGTAQTARDLGNALPAAAPNAAGGLLITAAGSLDMDDIGADVDAIETRVTTALPNAAPNAAGGLPISAAGGLDMDDIGADVDAIETAIAALTANAIRDAVWAEAVIDLASLPAANDTAIKALSLLFMAVRNLGTQTATTETIYRADGVTPLASRTVTDNGTTFTSGSLT